VSAFLLPLDRFFPDDDVGSVGIQQTFEKSIQTVVASSSQQKGIWRRQGW
jgi:hypothetical protein